MKVATFDVNGINDWLPVGARLDEIPHSTE
jgi:hypothetical protein